MNNLFLTHFPLINFRALGVWWDAQDAKYYMYEQMCHNWILQPDENPRIALFHGKQSEISSSFFQFLKIDIKNGQNAISILGVEKEKR